MPNSFSYLSVSAAGALLAKAIAAVNGPVASRKEGHLGVLATLGADCWVHLARAGIKSAAGVASGCPARWAPLGLVGVALVGMILLIVSTKYKA